MGERDNGTDDPLPIHPGIHVLRMPNGLTAWVLRHAKPAGAVAMCLHVGVGSLYEAEDERGASHMLEHLAFAGGARFPPGELARFFDSVGARLGRDCNAFTGLERTCYTLSLPDNGDHTIERGLAALADFAYGMSLRAAAVDQERRIILEEMRQHQEAKTRIRKRILSLLLPESPIADRHPLGSSETVRSITVGRLRSYYSRWYRPDNSTLLVAGDVDPRQVEHSIRQCFAGWTAPREPLPRRPSHRVQSHLASQAAVFTEPEIQEAEIRLVELLPTQPLVTTGRLRSWLQEEMILELFQQRLATLLREGQTAFRAARWSASPLVADFELLQAVASGPPGRWRDVLQELLRELRRVRLHGFSASEVAEVRETMSVAALRGDREQTNANSGHLLEEMTGAVPAGRPPMSPAQKRELFDHVLPAITPKDLRRSFSRLDPSGRLVVAVLPELADSDRPSEQELLRLHRHARSGLVEPLAARARAARLIAEVPKPGSVAGERHDQGLGLATLTFDNGVRVHVLQMESGSGRVHLQLTLAGGRIREHEDNLGITGAAALPFFQPATEALSSSEIHRSMAGKDLAFRCTVDEDAVVVEISGDAQSIEFGLQLIHQLLTRPRIEDSALERWRSQIGRSRASELEAQLSLEALRLLTGDDPRFRLIRPEQALAIDKEQADQWLRKLCRAPLEAAIVGGLDPERARSLALRYLGSLPSRPLHDPDLDRLRRLEPDEGPLEARLRVATATRRAAILSGWRAAPWQAADHRRLLRLASRILTQRLHREIREGQGLTYNAESAFTPSKAFPAASLFSIAFYTPPDRVGEAGALTRGLVRRLVSDGPSEREMDTARKQLSELARRAEKEPRFWCRVLADSCYRGLGPEDLKDLPARYHAYTREDLQAALSLYLTEERRLSVSCLPLDPGGQGQL